MRFTPVLPALGFAAAANAAVSASTLTTNLDSLTSKVSDTDDTAKTIGVTNIFATAPQVIGSYKDVIQMTNNDLSTLDGGASKRDLQARQECLDVTDVEKCVMDLGEIVEDPSEILGGKAKAKRQAAGFSDAEQSNVCNSFKTLAMTYEGFLQTLIGKHGVLSLTPFTQPIAAEIRAEESAFDSLGFGIADMVPTCADSLLQSKRSVDSTTDEAQSTYE